MYYFGNKLVLQSSLLTSDLCQSRTHYKAMR